MPDHKIDSTTTIHYTNTEPRKIPTTPTPTLILLHFWGGTSSTFTPLIAHLPTYPTLRPSFRGWGLSTGPPDPAAYSIRRLASDVSLLIHSLAIKDFILVGHSMGAKVAQLLAGQELPGLRGMVLLAPAPGSPLILPGEMKEQQISAYDSAEAAEFVVRNVLTSSVSAVSEGVVAALVKDAVGGSGEARRAWPTYAMGEDITAEVGKIDVPVLVIAGELDRVEPVERLRSEVVARIAGAEMVVVEGSGHLLPVEAPAKIAAHIEEFVAKICKG